jgi:CrcB protein
MPASPGLPDWRSLALVAVGGACGTALREALSLSVPPVGGVPVVTIVINVAGAFLLGLLLEALVRSGADASRQQALRLLLGTGALGGFTTYSALAVDSNLLLGSDGPLRGLAYAAGTLVLGALATWAGIAVAARRHPGRGSYGHPAGDGR